MTERELAFYSICQSISNIILLCIPLPEYKLSLVTAASGLGIGAVLQVRRYSLWEVAAFYSCQMRGAENQYSATEIEATAKEESIKHFAYYLYGR